MSTEQQKLGHQNNYTKVDIKHFARLRRFKFLSNFIQLSSHQVQVNNNVHKRHKKINAYISSLRPLACC